MSTTLKRLYVDFLRERYRATQSRSVKIMIIDQLCRDTGFHRKHAIRTLNHGWGIKKKAGRKSVYGDASRYHLKKLWLKMDQMNGRRMKKMLPVWLKSYQGIGFGPLVEAELLRMSHATIERFLKPYRAQLGRRLRTGTKGSRIKYKIPMKPLDRNVAMPGYLEADTVAHCGESMAGQFVWSLTCVDRHSGWTEVRAVWSKNAKQIVEAIKDIEEKAPFVIKGISTDNGSEFLNQELLRHLGPNEKRKTEIFMTRSRPYKKNDQCYVEQKNYTHVRKLLGYDRLDCPEVLPMINDLYTNEWSDLQNYFYPQMKLKEKIRVGGKYKRKYDDPKTPYNRLMESPQIPEETKKKMTEKFNSLNPFELTDRVEKKLKLIWATQKKFEQTHNRRSVASLPPSNIIH